MAVITNEQYNETKAELATIDQKYVEIMQEVHSNIQTVNLFSYIQRVNPRLSNEETAEFVDLVFKYSDEFKVDPYMIFSKARIESDFTPHAFGAAGERGFIQVMLPTYKIYMNQFGYDVKDFNDWRCTLKVGIAHYGYLVNKHNDWFLAEAEYNAGSRGNWVNRASNHVKKVRTANRAISKYKRVSIAN